MIYKGLKKIARKNNWHRTDDSVFGLYKGFCYNIFQSGIMNSPSYKIIQCRTGHLDDMQVSRLKEYLDLNKGKFGYDVFEIGPDFVKVIFYENLRMVKAAKLELFLEKFSEQLAFAKVPAIVSDANYAYYNLSGEGVMLTTEGYKKERADIQQMDEGEDIERSSYLRGLIGAILFSIPVIILWVFVAVYMEMLSTGLGLLMALSVFWGYEKFKGRLGVPTKWILVFVTIISVLIANLATLYYQLSVTIPEFISLLQNDNQIKGFFRNKVALGLIIGGVGLLWIILGLKPKRRYLKQAKKVK